MTKQTITGLILILVSLFIIEIFVIYEETGFGISSIVFGMMILAGAGVWLIGKD